MIITIDDRAPSGKIKLAWAIEGHFVGLGKRVRWELPPPPIGSGPNPVLVGHDEIVIVDELPSCKIRGYEHRVTAGGVLVLIKGSR